jgi:hypothetical protein
VGDGQYCVLVEDCICSCATIEDDSQARLLVGKYISLYMLK